MLCPFTRSTRLPAACLTLAGCAASLVSEPPGVDLRLDGPDEVRVEALGPVEGAPRAVLSDGSEPVGLVWAVSPEGVARMGPSGVVAVAPGEATIRGTWQAQEVSWLLRVEPPVTLRFVDPPSAVLVGRTVVLRIQGHLGDEVVEDVGPLSWESSNEGVLIVSAGEATGVEPGVAYVTAESASGSRATVQLTIGD